MKCLACERDLPEAALEFHSRSEYNVNVLLCACQALMIYEAGVLRPPRVHEAELFVYQIWPKLSKETLEALQSAAENPDGTMRYAVVTGETHTPNPEIKTFKTEDCCPQCHTPFHSMRGRSVPRPGGLTLCAACSAVSVMGEDMKSRPPTTEESQTDFYQSAMDVAARVAIQKAERQATS